jgi:arylsulfatase A-like enzyme
MDPHDPYHPPKGFERRFSTPSDGPEFVENGDPNPLEAMVYAGGDPVEVSDEDLQHLVDRYDDEIAYFDDQFGLLLEALEARGLSDTTMVVLASDHGEEFLQEHGHVKHCRALFDSSTRTPLVMKIPGVRHDGPIATPVENVGITPTILDYLGFGFDDFGFEGRSLRKVIESGARTSEYRYSQQGVQRSVDDGRNKLIVRLTTRKRQLYDLEADPGEQNDLFAPGLPVVEPLEASLAEWRARVEKGMNDEESVRVSEEAQEQLRALGYLQ